MNHIKTDLDEMLSLEDKKKILRDIQQDDLLDLFKKGYAPQYTAPERVKENSLDHQISITISKEERDFISKELTEIKNSGAPTSLSSFIRSRSIAEIDLLDWNEKSMRGLVEFTKPDWDLKKLEKVKRRYIKMIDDVENNPEDEQFYKEKIDDLNKKIENIKKKSFSRTYRVAGRVTYDEANKIRWRAARLTLTVADYIRFLIFGYVPFEGGQDSHLSLEARKRFYIAIADVHKNGWGEPPKPDETDISKLKREIKELKQKIQRYESIFKQKGLSSFI